MAKRGKTTVIPRLRFPEFREGAGWVMDSLSSVCQRITQGGTPDTSNPDYWNGEINWLTPAEMGKTHSPFIASTHRTITELGLQNCSSELLPSLTVVISTRAPIGHLAINTVPMAINQGCKGLIPKPDLHHSFLFSSLQLAKLKLIDLGAGNTFKELSGSALKSFCIPIPKRPEQQKIADCLTSLDEVIAAQRRKIEALKTYKRGLMQQIFPREGETVPRLRFPEFRNGASWTLRKIGDLLEEVPRPIDMNDDIEYSLVTVKRRYGGVVSRERLKGRAIKVKSQFVVRANDFLISKRQIVHNACGIVPLELDGSIVSNEYSVLGPKGGCDIEFFNYFSQQPSVSASFLNSSVGIVIEKMLFKPDIWLKHEFLFPPFEEQKRIAAFLGSLEKGLVAESNKHDALRAHKKGLMQQLFPAGEET